MKELKDYERILYTALWFRDGGFNERTGVLGYSLEDGVYFLHSYNPTLPRAPRLDVVNINDPSIYNFSIQGEKIVIVDDEGVIINE